MATPEQDSQPLENSEGTKVSSKSLEDFIGTEQELQKEIIEDPAEEPGQGISGRMEGITPEEIAGFIGSLTVSMVPQKYQEAYIKDHYNIVTKILQAVDVEELTEGMTAKQLPKWARVFGAIGGTAGVTVLKLKKYNPKKTSEEKYKEDQEKMFEEEGVKK